MFTWLAHPGSAEDSQLHLRAFGHDSGGGQRSSANQSVSSKVSHPSSHPPGRRKQLLRKQWSYMLRSALMRHYFSTVWLICFLFSGNISWRCFCSSSKRCVSSTTTWVTLRSVSRLLDFHWQKCESLEGSGVLRLTDVTLEVSPKVTFQAKRIMSCCAAKHIFPGLCMFLVMSDRGPFCEGC